MNLKKMGLWALAVSFAFSMMAWKAQDAHKFYLSVSQLSYNEKDQAIQMTCRIFIDDFNALLKERYGVVALMGSGTESELAVNYAKEYIQKKIQLFEDDRLLPLNILGFKKDNDVLIYFVEAPTDSFLKAQKFEVQHTLLSDLFETQQNVVHLKLRGLKKSFLLMRDKASGIIYFNK